MGSNWWTILVEGRVRPCSVCWLNMMGEGTFLWKINLKKQLNMLVDI